jgi:CIC family chloride channel protein
VPKRLASLARQTDLRLSRAGRDFISWLERRGVGESAIVVGFAVLTGTVVGASVLAFYWLIDEASHYAAEAVEFVATNSNSLFLGNMAIMAAGLVLVRLIVRYATNDSPGENIPDVMHAVARRGGVLHATPVLAKTVGAAVTLSAGGSVGAEGPVAVLGAAVASRAGRYVHFSAPRLRLMVSCGAAAGIAGAFGAPLAGVFFALEKLTGTGRNASLAPIVVACAAAAAITRNGLGSAPVIAIPAQYGISAPRDLVLYGLLGLAAGVVAVIYTRAVWWAQDLLGRWRPVTRVVIAAAAIAALTSMFEPTIWGSGHQRLDLGVVTDVVWWGLIVLAAAKILATALTFGGGGVGGVFTPALVVGGAFGAGLAGLISTIQPQWPLEPVAFGLVGMAAIVSGSMHAPLTAVFMVLEMSNDYGLVLPLMLGSALAYLVSRGLNRESIYSEWLVRRGERLSGGLDEMVLGQLRVGDVTRRDILRLKDDLPLGAALALTAASPQTIFPVVDSQDHLLGAVSWADLRAALRESPTAVGRPVGPLADAVVEVVTVEDNLDTALRRLGLRDASLLPVVEDEQSRRLVGGIGRSDVMAAYDRAVESGSQS